MEKYIACIKGISGAGKSTRVYLLLKFIREILQYEMVDYLIKDTKGKDKSIGYLFPKLDLIFIGKIYESGEISRFQGLDAQTGVFGSNLAISEFLKSESSKHSIILEGAGTTQSNRFRPKFLHEHVGYKNIYMQYYNYGGEVNHEEYYNRIIYRSGKKPTRDTMWDKEQSYTKEVTFSKKELEDLGNKANVILHHNLYNEVPWDFGVKMLQNYINPDLVEDFIEFVKIINYIDENRYENFKK